MEQQPRRRRLKELNLQAQQDNQQDSQKESTLDKPLTLGKGQHLSPLPDGGYMIITDGFNRA